MKFNLILHLILVQFFFKTTLLWLNEVWNSSSNIILTFWQWAVKLSFSNYPIPFEDSWWKIDFNIKMTSPIFFPTIIIEANPSLGHEDSFYMAIGWISFVFFVKGFLRFLTNHFNISLLICLFGLRFSKKKRAQ